MVLFGSIADETTDPSTSILGIRVVSSTNPVLSDDTGCARINEEAGINIIQKKSACTLHVDPANRSIVMVVLALFNEPTTIVTEGYIKGQGWTTGEEIVCKELGNGFYGLDVNDSDGFIWDCFASVIIDNPTYDYSANFRVWSELPVVDMADPAEWMEYISTPAEPERFWTPVAFVDQTELSRFSLAGSSDVSPVNNVTADDMYWLSPESALDVRVNDKLAVSVTYTIPILLGGEYTFAKLVYKPQFRPTSPDDGQVIDLEIHPGVQQTQVITDMNLAQPWWFVIYTNRNESEAVELDVHILAPQLNRVSLYEYNNAQIEYKILPYIYSPYVNITLVAKIGSAPQSASDGDKFMLLQENAVEAVMTELAENTTYYFAIFVEDGNGNTASSNVMQLTTSERLLPPATISQTSVNIDYITVDFTIPELVDNTYDYIRIVFKADSEPTTDTDGSYYDVAPDQTHVTKQLSANTTYHIAIFSKDIYGKEVKSNVVTATTSHYVMPSATLDSVSIDVVTATVTCTLPELPRYNYATAILAAKKDSEPVSTADADVTASLDYSTYTQQTAVVDSLNELSTYYFKIFTTDSEGNEAQSNVIHAETGTLLKAPTILQLTLGERGDWDGSEIDIMWSGQNNKMTAQIDSSQIVFTLYASNTAIYSFISPVGTSVEDIDNIQASFLIDEENQVAKPSFIYYNGSTYSYNQEQPTEEEVANIYLWLNPAPVFEDYWRNVPFEDDASGSDWTPLTLDEEWMNGDEHNWSSIPSTAITNMGTLIHTSKYYQIALSMQDGDEYKDELFNNGCYKVWIELQAIDSGPYIYVDAKLWIQNLHTLHSEHADLNSDVTNYWDDDNQSFYFGFVENSKCTDWESPTSIALALLYHVDMGYCFVDSTVDSGSLYDAFNDDRYDPLP